MENNNMLTPDQLDALETLCNPLPFNALGFAIGTNCTFRLLFPASYQGDGDD